MNKTGFWTRAISLALIMVLSLAVLAGCGNTTTNNTSSTNNTTNQTTTNQGSNNTSTSSENTSDSGDNQAASFSPMKLTASSSWAVTHMWHNGYYVPFMDEVTEGTGGAVTFDVFTGGELVQANYELDALRQGQCDVALSITPMLDANRYPLSGVTLLPVSTTNVEIATKAMGEMIASDRVISDGKTYYELDFGDNNLVVWPTPATDPYLICLKKGVSITSAADFNANLRIRTSGSAAEAFVSNLGATPTTIVSAEVYDALSRGAIEGVLLPTEWVSLGITELVGDVLNTSSGTSLSFIGVSKDKWDSWSPELQELFNKAYADCYEAGIQAVNDKINSATAALEEAGGQIIPYDDLPDDVKQKLDEANTATWYTWIDSMESRGVAGKEMAILWRDCLVNNGATLPEQLMHLEDYTPNT